MDVNPYIVVTYDSYLNSTKLEYLYADYTSAKLYVCSLLDKLREYDPLNALEDVQVGIDDPDSQAEYSGLGTFVDGNFVLISLVDVRKLDTKVISKAPLFKFGAEANSLFELAEKSDKERFEKMAG